MGLIIVDIKHRNWRKKDILKLKQLTNKGFTHSQNADIFGLSSSGISSICKRNNIKSICLVDDATIEKILIELKNHKPTEQICKKYNLTLRRFHYIRQVINKKKYYTSKVKQTIEENKLFYEKHKNHSDVTKLICYRFIQCKARANKYSMPFTITREDLVNLYHKQKGLCYYSGIKMRTQRGNTTGYKRESCSLVLSIDRIDSNGGYTLDNIALCCDCINTMKMAMPEQMFLFFCSKIFHHSINK